MFSQSAEQIQYFQIDDNDCHVSYDVTALFVKVLLDETIHILEDKAFSDNWFNNTNNRKISRDDLIELLSVATKDQLFHFNGTLMYRSTMSK